MFSCKNKPLMSQNQEDMTFRIQELMDKDFIQKMVINHQCKIHSQKPKGRVPSIWVLEVQGLEIIKCILNLNDFDFKVNKLI